MFSRHTNRNSNSRAVFAGDIKRGLSQAPPNGTNWVAEVLQYDSGGTSVPFTLQLEVHDEQGKLASEEQDISLKQLKKWIVLIDTERNGKDVCMEWCAPTVYIAVADPIYFSILL